MPQFELKLSDSTANPYLALAGILASGLDGLSNKLTLRPALGVQQQNGDVPDPLPKSLNESLDFLEKDELLINNVLPKAMSQGYLATRRSEYERASKMSLEEEVQEALNRA